MYLKSVPQAKLNHQWKLSGKNRRDEIACAHVSM
jgi:hypothetical protein